MLRCFFDVDGVVLDFENSYLRVISAYFQLDLPENFRTTRWDFSELLTEQQQLEGWEYFVNSNAFRELESLVPAPRFNEVFVAYPVHFVTNIPPEHMDARRENLSQVGYRFESAHPGGFLSFNEQPPRTKSQVIADLVQHGEQILFVDDHPRNCVDVKENFPEAWVWLMSRPFNQDFDHPTIQRAKHWEQVLQSLPTAS